MITDAMDGEAYKVYLGIDPGANGGWGVVNGVGEYVDCGHVHDLTFGVPDGVAVVALEHICLRPQDVRGGKIFRLQHLLVNYGELRGILQVHGLPCIEVMPRVWQGHFNIEPDDVLYAARLLWPTAPLTRKKDDGRAAGLLLAEYARIMGE